MTIDCILVFGHHSGRGVGKYVPRREDITGTQELDGTSLWFEGRGEARLWEDR